MQTNSDITIYNKYIDPGTRKELYLRTNIRAVTWEDRKAAEMLAAGGKIAANSARIFIPFQRGEGSFLSPREWQASVVKSSFWTLQEGDVIVKGLISDEITTGFPVSALQAKYYKVLIISSIDSMDNGSYSMRHWQVGAA